MTRLGRDLRRQVVLHGPWWAAWQLGLTLATVWVLWRLGARALDWALHAARWGAVRENLRLFLVGAYPSGDAGGLLLTLGLTAGALALAFPLGVALALGRRSRLPLVKGLSVGFIELIRGVPLVTLLYMVALLVPLMLPDGARPGNAMRAIAGLAVFTAAYLAEDMRGGLAAVGAGQFEAARALGLGGYHTYRLIVLPQALRAVIPALVGQFISLFKNTALVVVILPLRELLGVARAVANQPAHLGTYRETLLFVSIIYFALSYGLSRYSARLEASQKRRAI